MVLELAIPSERVGLRPPQPEGFPGKLVERHLEEMVAEGLLERTHRDNLAHPAQPYRAAKQGDK